MNKCFVGELSARLRAELVEVDQDYNPMNVSDEQSGQENSESEAETPLEAVNHWLP